MACCVPGENTTQLFAVAAINIGVGDTVIAEADTGLASIPLDVSICPTNAGGVCLTAPGTEVQNTILSGELQTFNVFARSSGPIAFDPVANRVDVRFTTPDGLILGSTSVAVTADEGGSDNAAPIAEAGDDQVWEGGEVALDGSGSSDPDGDPIAYAWALATPEGSTATLTNPNSVNPTFTPDLPGQYVAQLLVADADSFSVPDAATITVPGQLEVTASFETLTIDLGDSINLTTTVAYVDDGSGETRTVEIVQTVSPDTGLNINPAIDPGFSGTEDVTQVDNQALTPSVTGGFEITTTATITETGESTSVVSQLSVVEPSSDPSLFTPGTNPSVIPPGESTPVLFTTRLDNSDGTGTVEIVSLNDLFTPTVMNDSGDNGDVLADDGVFSASVAVDPSLGDLTAGDCAEFQTLLTENSTEYRSPAAEVCVSAFGNLAGTPEDAPVFGPVGGDGLSGPSNLDNATLVANELFLFTIDGLLEADLEALATSIGAEVVGGFPQQNLFQIRLTNAPGSREDLQNLADALASRPDIVAVDFNTIESFEAVTPDDTNFGSQDHLTRVRADEAWVVSRGWGFDIIGIVDSGVDLTHSELDGLLLGNGVNVGAGPGTTADDQLGHGTSVAGTAAAETDNNSGVAGVSWNNPIYPVRIADSNAQLTPASMAAGIRAAADAGAFIINASFGTSNNTVLCPAVTYARNRGAIVVAAAGNGNASTLRYPAACSGVIAVGASTNTDTRASFSQFGTWVDIAAPGVGIVTTSNNGGIATGGVNGTSFSSPLTSGVVALIAAREAGLSGPTISNAEIVRRLTALAQPVSALSTVGGRRVDAFEAVFNGNFEDPALSYWTRSASGSTNGGIATATPRSGTLMGYVSTGPGGQETSGGLRQDFVIQPGVTSLPISFEWAFLSEEFDEFCGTNFDDDIIITLEHSAGTATLLNTSVNQICAANGNALPNINTSFDQGDVKWTEWQHCSLTVDVAEGNAAFIIQTQDAGDSIYDTVVLVDAIRFNNDAIANQGPASEFCGAQAGSDLVLPPVRELSEAQLEQRREAYRERWGTDPDY